MQSFKQFLIEGMKRAKRRGTKFAAEKEAKRLERERAKAEKELKKRVEKPTSAELQIPGVKRSDIANTRRLESFFAPNRDELEYDRLIQASRRIPEEQLSFTEPSESVFKFAEGGGI